MKILLLLITGVLLLSAQATDEAAIRVQACYSLFYPTPVVNGQSIDSAEQDVKSIKVWLYITNISDAIIRIPTKGRVAIDRKKGEFRLTLIVAPQSNPLKIPVTLPECEYSIVELRPGETTMISESDIGEEVNFKSVKVVYEVESVLALRYRLWAGRVEIFAKNLYPVSQSKE